MKEIKTDSERNLLDINNGESIFESKASHELNKEYLLQHKELISLTSEIKACKVILDNRELKLKNKLSISKHNKNYILNIQNQQVMAWLLNYKNTLKENTKSLTNSFMIEEDVKEPSLIKKIKNLAIILKKLNIYISQSEGNKERTNNFFNGHIRTTKETIIQFTTLITNKMKDILIEMQIMKSLPYLDRKLYILHNPDIFIEEHDKELFLNCSFFNARLNNLSKLYAYYRYSKTFNKRKISTERKFVGRFSPFC